MKVKKPCRYHSLINNEILSIIPLGLLHQKELLVKTFLDEAITTKTQFMGFNGTKGPSITSLWGFRNSQVLTSLPPLAMLERLLP